MGSRYPNSSDDETLVYLIKNCYLGRNETQEENESSRRHSQDGAWDFDHHVARVGHGVHDARGPVLLLLSKEGFPNSGHFEN